MVKAICAYTNQQDKENELCFRFIDTVLNQKHNAIMEDLAKSQTTGVTLNSSEDKYKDLILKLVEILCEKKYKSKAMEYMRRDYFPIEQCLEICEKKRVPDACAVLY